VQKKKGKVQRSKARKGGETGSFNMVFDYFYKEKKKKRQRR
jgi:hypothetical protein